MKTKKKGKCPFGYGASNDDELAQTDSTTTGLAGDEADDDVDYPA